MSLIVPDENAVFEGELKLFERGSDSGRVLRCFFCPTCGTRIYHQPSYAPVVNIRAGTLDETSGLQPVLHAWLCSKQGWMIVPDGVEQYDMQPSALPPLR